MTKERRFIVVSDEQGYQPGPGISCSIIDTRQQAPVCPADGLECCDMRWLDAVEFCRALNQLQEDHERYELISKREVI